jgi:hypothetical protein
MTHIGKIARLPRKIREELNVRLDNGEVGRALVAWLNGLPAAQAVLAAKFGGRPINAQNLSDWKKGGYEDWRRHQEDCAHACMLTENSGDLEKEAGEIRLEERLVAPMAMSLARLLRKAEESPGGFDMQKRVLAVARQLSQLRRESHQAERVRLERERLEMKQAEVREKQRQAAEARALCEQVKAEFPSPRSEGVRNAGGMPLQEARPHPVLLPQERELNCGPGARGARGLAEAPIKVNQGKSSQTR